MLRAAAVDLLLGRSWIRHDLLAYVFRWSKIAPLLDPGLSILVSALGLFLRKGGGIHELYSEYPPPNNRQTHEVRALWQAWAKIVGEDLLTQAASANATIKQRINSVKTLILRHMMQQASSYIRKKVLVAGWTGGVSWTWLSQAFMASKRWIPSMARFTLLRWAVNEDDDDWLSRRGTSRLRRCAMCANTGRAYPLGGCQIVVCEACISCKQITAFTLENLSLPPIGRPIDVLNVDETENNVSHAHCVACSTGDNTVGHWVRWCKVPIIALRNLTGDLTLMSLLEGTRKSAKHLAIATRVVHQFRLLLREAGAMRHQVAAPLVSTDSWITHLTQRVHGDLPSDLRIVHIPAPQASNGCSLDSSNLSCQDKSPLHISCALAPARICCVGEAVDAHQTLGVVQLGSEHSQLIQQSFQVGTGIVPNAKISPFYCQCGEYHCRITATLPIGAGEILCCCTSEEKGSLLVQFDGSCHADRGIGGAGAALLEVQPQGLALIRWRAVALPKCPDNIYAEAMSADIGTDLLCDELTRRRHAATQIYLQGDILPIVKHLAFAGRFRRIDLQPIVQRIRKKQSRMFDFGIWMYRPREANIIADHLAGEASKAAYDLPQNQIQPLEMDLPAPYNVAMRAGAIVLEERAAGETILVLPEVPSATPQQIRRFLMQADHHKYIRDTESYLTGTANLSQPRFVEYTATSVDKLGRLYGRGPCAQRLPRKLRMLLFGATHQEIDMTGSFYEIMRRICRDPHLPHIGRLRDILADLLGLVPQGQRQSTIKRHPLIVMNAGAKEACSRVEREFGISCPTALLHLSLKIEAATKTVVEELLPRLRPQYSGGDRGATFRTLEWYEEHIMITFYKELTRRFHLRSVIWLHDGLWIPREVPISIIQTSELSMLHLLQLERTAVFRIQDLAVEAKELTSALENEPDDPSGRNLFPNQPTRCDPPLIQADRTIRWNTQAQTAGYQTFVERTAKRRRKL